MIKAGILGGGQLGRMLLQAAANYPVETHVLEKDPGCPSAHLCHQFKQGDITRYEDVLAFGTGLDVLTIEIEQVNVEALEALEQQGVTIIPKPATLRIIRDKIKQKQFYAEQQVPSSPFLVTQNQAELAQHTDFLPAVHKLASGGYDGRGVQIINNNAEIELGFDAPSVLEKKVTVRREISILIAVGKDGDTAIYPPVDMIFDPQLNQLSHQIAPAQLPDTVFWKADSIALNAVKKLNSPGLFAVEMFADANDNVLVNEIAPRVHNSGHHTIEASYCSQFDMLWRILLGYPLGNTKSIQPAALVNIVGAPGFEGEAFYEGLENILSMDNVFVHIYGKAYTKPGRKMGHITVLSADKQDLLHRVNQIRHRLRVIAR
jgi:5-(carboxyamino)imidazole ribonucleotide synthase